MNIPLFVKWAGGKKQLLKQFKDFIPKEIEYYCEPMVGGGAVLFYLLQTKNIKKVIIADINDNLLTAYEVVRDNVNELIEELKIHKRKYEDNKKEYYYKARDEYNHKKQSKVEKVARFIFLNKTCFNGLYRVNKKGEFNVPKGSYKNPSIVREEVLRKASKLLQNVEIKHQSFEKTPETVTEDFFVYFDPPYRPINGTSFTNYTKLDFKKEDQEKLAEVYKELDKKGCKVMLSNSDTELINDLYKDFNVNIVKARRAINSNAKGRGKINEIVVVNY